MTADELAANIEAHISASTKATPGALGIENDELLVIKYLPAKYLAAVIQDQQLYASERAGFT